MVDKLTKKDIENGLFMGIPCRFIRCGDNDSDFLYCATDICKFYNRDIKDFKETLFGKACLKNEIIAIKGKYYSGTFAPQLYCYRVYSWCVNNTHHVHMPSLKRLEISFFETLQSLLYSFPISEEAMTLLYQQPFGKYKVDAYLPYGDLIIEYNESYHKKMELQDNNRKKEIISLSKNPNMNFIVVEEGKEIEGMKQIFECIFKIMY